MPKILEMALVYWSLSKWLTVTGMGDSGWSGEEEKRRIWSVVRSFTRAVFIVVRKLPSVGGGHSKQAPSSKGS